MKACRVFLLLLASIALSVSAAAQSYIFFSEYVEGSSNNKALEIYNGTAGTLDLGASSAQIKIYINGSSLASTPISLTGTIASGGVHVIANSASAAGLLAVANSTSSGLTFNGDDAVELVINGTTMDIIGQIGMDPGSGWGTAPSSTVNQTLVRKSSVNTGDVNGGNVFDPSSEWDAYAVDEFSNLGAHSGPILPVQAQGLTISGNGLEATITWKTVSEVNCYGFNVERTHLGPNGVRSDWTKVGFVSGAGTSTSLRHYELVDPLSTAGRYAYRITQIDFDGSRAELGELEIELGGAPRTLSLAQNFPNPFNPSTHISFTIPDQGWARLSVFDALGRHVATLFDGNAEAGRSHSVLFDGSRNPSGTYVVRLESAGMVVTRKVTLIK